jgi:hypothetical protein
MMPFSTLFFDLTIIRYFHRSIFFFRYFFFGIFYVRRFFFDMFFSTFLISTFFLSIFSMHTNIIIHTIKSKQCRLYRLSNNLKLFCTIKDIDVAYAIHVVFLFLKYCLTVDVIFHCFIRIRLLILSYILFSLNQKTN